MNDVRLNCNACNTFHSMSATKVRRLSWIVVLIGWILTIPSILGLLLAILIFIGGVYFTSSTIDNFGESIPLIDFLIYGSSFYVGISSLVGGLVGYLLIMKKKVYKCSMCGYIMDRD